MKSAAQYKKSAMCHMMLFFTLNPLPHLPSYL